MVDLSKEYGPIIVGAILTLLFFIIFTSFVQLKIEENRIISETGVIPKNCNYTEESISTKECMALFNLHFTEYLLIGRFVLVIFLLAFLFLFFKLLDIFIERLNQTLKTQRKNLKDLLGILVIIIMIIILACLTLGVINFGEGPYQGPPKTMLEVFCEPTVLFFLFISMYLFLTFSILFFKLVLTSKN